MDWHECRDVWLPQVLIGEHSYLNRVLAPFCLRLREQYGRRDKKNVRPGGRSGALMMSLFLPYGNIPFQRQEGGS